MMATMPDRRLFAAAPLLHAMRLNKATLSGGFTISNEMEVQNSGSDDSHWVTFDVAWQEFVKDGDGRTVMQMDGPVTRPRSARVTVEFNTP